MVEDLFQVTASNCGASPEVRNRWLCKARISHGSQEATTSGVDAHAMMGQNPGGRCGIAALDIAASWSASSGGAENAHHHAHSSFAGPWIPLNP